jgi:hypothetical protein
MHHHKHSHRVSFIKPERIEELLRPLIPDQQDRDFILRCLLQEGPEHHRGANYVLLAFLGELSAGRQTAETDGISVPMRLPPHLQSEGSSQNYPIKIPSRILERLATRGSRELKDMIDCLTDGPPQHSLANVVMLCLLDSLLEKDRLI